MSIVRKSAEIAAPAHKIVATMLDVENHSTWMTEINRIEVLEIDGEGRPLRTRVHVAAMGQVATYEVLYTHHSPLSFEYHLSQGDVMTANDFTFAAEPIGERSSRVTLSQELSVRWPLPGFIVDQLTLKGVKDMLRSLAAQVQEA